MSDDTSPLGLQRISRQRTLLVRTHMLIRVCVLAKGALRTCRVFAVSRKLCVPKRLILPVLVDRGRI